MTQIVTHAAIHLGWRRRIFTQ